MYDANTVIVFQIKYRTTILIFSYNIAPIAMEWAAADKLLQSINRRKCI